MRSATTRIGLVLCVLTESRDWLEKWILDTDYRREVHYAHPHARPRVPGQEYDVEVTCVTGR